MKKGSTNRTVGLDISDKLSTYVVLDDEGRVVEEGKVATSRVGLAKKFADQPGRMAIEAGCHSPWMSRFLSELGHEVIVANPRQVALIAKNQRKTDRLDAMRLARLARMDPQLLSRSRIAPNRARNIWRCCVLASNSSKRGQRWSTTCGLL
jgi:transposase